MAKKGFIGNHVIQSYLFNCLAGHSSLDVTTDGYAKSSKEMLSNHCNVPDVSLGYNLPDIFVVTCIPCNCREMPQGVVTKLRKTAVRHVDLLFFSIAEGKSLTCRTRPAVGFFYAEQNNCSQDKPVETSVFEISFNLRNNLKNREQLFG